MNDFKSKLQGETGCTRDVYAHVKAFRQKITLLDTQTEKKVPSFPIMGMAET